MKADIQNKINEIAHIIIDKSKLKDINYGLFNGKSGMILFLYYYSAWMKSNEYHEIADNLIIDTFKRIEELNEIDLNFCEGICGFYSLLCHLEQNNFISNEFIEFDKEFDDCIYDACVKAFDKRNFDYLYGATGLFYYLANRYKVTKKDEYTKMINKIIHLIYVKIKNNKDWLAYYHLIEGEINFGIAHGITSLFLLLTQITHLTGIDKTELFFILSQIYSYYIPYLNKNNETTSYFPDNYNINKPIETRCTSRLAWCYGDLGCFIALLHYASAINNNILKDKIISILRYEVSIRKNLETNLVRDAGICHGSAGIAHIYQMLYYEYHYYEFKEAAEYWYKTTLNFARFPTGYAGFCESYLLNGTLHHENSTNFIGGIAGIGLSFMSYLSPEYSKWDSILLI